MNYPQIRPQKCGRIMFYISVSTSQRTVSRWPHSGIFHEMMSPVLVSTIGTGHATRQKR